ncbi:MAG TPA: hypothetical protein VFA34_03565 [Actinomycetota bacterium]|jgi:F0F1-type ATP synthase assembly protein I|nr:hypothetical protein [Actinomycetota bacterium]
MHLFISAVVVVAGAILIAAVDESVRGIEASTIGGILVLLGLVYALGAFLLRQRRHEFDTRRPEDDEPAAFPRR